MRRASSKKRKVIKIDLSETLEISPQKDGGSKHPRDDWEMMTSLPTLDETSSSAWMDVNALLTPAAYEKLSMGRYQHAQPLC